MKFRQVFCAQDYATAQAAMVAARTAGADDEDISLIARADIEMERLPHERLPHHSPRKRHHPALRAGIYPAATTENAMRATAWKRMTRGINR